ncbi:MAG: hypothetical protein J6U92_05365 [Clostridia bacterium]|nr:hypothetical protein [Clostridia bacterium]
MAELKFGWSEVDITPGKGTKIGLAGQFFERITDEVESHISVTALTIDSGSDYVIMCACDLVAVSENLNILVKEKLAKNGMVNPKKVILSAIHTHTSYIYKRKTSIAKVNPKQYLQSIIPEDMAYKPLVSNEKGMDPNDALEFLANKIVEAVLLSWENREQGYYRNAFGRAAVGMCRRVCYDDGSALMWGDTNHANFTELEGGNDNGIELIFVYDKNKKITGVVANIACPAQVVEHRSYISSDYWGKVKDNLRKEYGEEVFVLGLCSAAGDQCPRDMIRWVEPESYIDDPNIKRDTVLERNADPSMFDISGLKVVGRRISSEIIAVHEELNSEYKDQAELIHETANITLPLRRVTKSEYANAVEMIDKFIEKNRGKTINFDDNAKMHVYSGIIARYELQKTVNTFEIETHFIRFGDIAIATNPFELFLDYGNQIRARSKAKQTFLIQLACGAYGYLPTEKAEKGSHYSAYVSSGYVGHEGGNLLVRKTIDTINKMF